jgi:hypothetical protein
MRRSAAEAALMWRQFGGETRAHASTDSAGWIGDLAACNAPEVTPASDPDEEFHPWHSACRFC